MNTTNNSLVKQDANARDVHNETRESWYGALERLKNQIAWIEYVPEEELTQAEANRLSAACERLLVVISKLNRKYMN